MAPGMTEEQVVQASLDWALANGFEPPRPDLIENLRRNYRHKLGMHPSGVIGEGGQGIIRADRDIGFHFSQNFGTSRFFPEF